MIIREFKIHVFDDVNNEIKEANIQTSEWNAQTDCHHKKDVYFFKCTDVL